MEAHSSRYKVLHVAQAEEILIPVHAETLAGRNPNLLIPPSEASIYSLQLHRTQAVQFDVLARASGHESDACDQ